MEFHPALYNIMVAAATISLCHISESYKKTVLGDCALRQSIETVDFKISSVVLMFSSLPMIVDLVMDLNTKFMSSNECYHFLGRLISTVTMCITAEQLSTRNILSSNNFSSILLSIFTFRMSTGSSLMFCLCVAKPTVFTPVYTTTVTTLLCITSFIRFQALGTDGTLHMVGNIFAYCKLLYITITLISLTSGMVRKSTIWMVDDYTSIFYLCVYLILLFSIHSPSFSKLFSYERFDVNILDLDPHESSTVLYMYSLTAVLLTIVPGRIARMNILALKDNIIETKQAYVRFISHELRTPLNTVCLGLKLSISQIPSNTKDPQEQERLETLDEISSATTVALDILNELLLYDKLEKGVLELNKENAHIFELVEGASKMFAVQFRQKSINFEIVSALDEMLNKQSQSSDNKKVETNSLSNSNLLRSDQIFVDKHKVEQVLRNLISNAIKFTPIGGNVTVKMKFIPKLDSTREHSHSSSFDKLIDDCYTDESATTLTEFLKNTASGKILEKCHSEEKIKGTLQLEVIDTGAGMREEDQKRLFHEIVQFQPQILQNGGGSGLGMWISKGIMDLHGGTISAYSQGEGNGSTFTLTFPMERCVHDGNISTNNGKLSFTSLRGAYGDNHNEELLSSLPGAQLSYINGSNNSCRLTTPGLPFGISPLTISCKNVHEVFFDSSKLLVVDDSPMNRKMLCKVLKQAGYTCEEASDGLEALNKVMHSLQIDEDKKTYYDCILMDFMMPNMDGPTATTEIRKIGYDGPIIGITGNVLKEDCNLFLQSGISRVLLKPVSLDTIQVILQEFGL